MGSGLAMPMPAKCNAYFSKEFHSALPEILAGCLRPAIIS
jgi:hypothetical protein